MHSTKNINDLNIQYFIELFLSRISKKSTRYYYKIYLYKILELDTIDEININRFFNTLNNAETSKKTIRSVWISFFNWLNRTQKTTLDTKEIKTFNYSPALKTIYKEKDKVKIFKYLSEFKNFKFELYFHIIAWNGCRLAESVKINLKDLYNNEKVQLQSLKKGKFRMIYANERIMYLLTKVDFFSWNKQTLANHFALFKKYVKKRDPKWNLDIKASQLRTQFITDFAQNKISSNEIQMITGHSTTQVIENVYIRTDETQMEKIFRRGKMPLFDALEIEQIENTYNNLNEKIMALKHQLEAEKEKNFQNKKDGVKEFIYLCQKIFGKKVGTVLSKVYEKMIFINLEKKQN